MICKITFVVLYFKATLAILMLSSKKCKTMGKMSTKKVINFTIVNVITLKKKKVVMISIYKRKRKRKSNQNKNKNKNQEKKKSNNK